MWIKSIFFFAFLLASQQGLWAQDSIPQAQDSVKTGIALGKLILENPSSIVSKYEYDPKIDRYVYTESIEDFNTTHPVFLTPDQYYELIRKESMKTYFKEKLDAFSGKKEGSEEARKNLLPNFYVNSGFFESIFGGNTVEVIPQGSVAMDLGVIWQKNDNPALSPRNRTNLSFDFDQRISLSLLGKVGERLTVTANYDTEATFDFQNLIKLDYTPTEDDIIQSIELGNVNMPLNSSLIQGAQSLFGVKTQLQFGKTTVTAVFSEQRSQNRSVVAQGGGTLNEFELTALDYDEDRHFFLSQFFRDNYNEALANYPFINSQVQITRIEVWVTNRNQQTLNTRNIVALQDLGEQRTSPDDRELTRIGITGAPPANFFDPMRGQQPDNRNNLLDPALILAGGGVLNDNIRDIVTVNDGFNEALAGGYNFVQGADYGILENARQLTVDRDYNFHPQLGYISLNQRLSNDEVLGVAFQYTLNGEVFQVGEFANGGTEATGFVDEGVNAGLIENNTLVVKMLKSNITNVDDPIWDLMMKNIYSTGAFQLDQEDFKFNILYNDPTPRNYITPVDLATWPEGTEDRILIELFGFDRLNIYNDIQPGGDGFFDYVPGITIDPETGRIIFTRVEPFGEDLFNFLGGGTYDVDNDQGYNENQARYVFRDMYADTKAASLQDAEKNRYRLKGRYKSQGTNGIPIGAFNVPRGSVRVTAGGRQLQEGIDYTVNYQAGTVQLLDPSLEASNVPINISVENNAIFGQQTRRFTGINVEHKFNENFILGGTFLNLNERPLTQKSNFGLEPVNNTILGLNGIYSTEVPFLTRLANKLPNIDTDAPSNLSVRGEFAYLIPNSPKNADFQGETTTYLDDFEGAQALIDIRASLSWALASPPLEFTENEMGMEEERFLRNYDRAKMSWYSIDPIFYTNQRPSGVNDDDISLNSTRRIFIDEVFPQTDIAQGQTQVQTTLDLSYYPNQRGPYNGSPNEDGPLGDSFESLNPNEKWAGIMRSLSSTNFEQSNVEFVQFWVLDPYIDGETTAANTGELVINLGNISEDILPDGSKQYENGLPSSTNTETARSTEWGRTPSTQSLVYAFDVEDGNRAQQDIGLDGLNDNDEGSYEFREDPNDPDSRVIRPYRENIGRSPDDPALDNYVYYLNREGGILERYLDFNNTEGNSPIEVTNTNRGSTTLPDVEDVDRDLTMNTVDSYFEYRIPIGPNVSVEDRYVTDIREGVASGQRIPNNGQRQFRWIQYKIPLSDFTNAVGGISDFRSVSFMRMYLTGFQNDINLRFATLDLVRGDWRTFTASLDENDIDPTDDGTVTDVNTVNIEENSQRAPIPYVLPPGVVREQLNNNNTIIRQNEQSLSFVVENLQPGDSRGVFKNVNIDARQYERLRMFMHAEELFERDYQVGETPLVGFLRIGTDFTENYYQIERALEFTEFGETQPTEVWPSVNEIDIAFSDLNRIKSVRVAERDISNLSEVRYFDIIDGQIVEVEEDAPRNLGVTRVGIKGNPSLGSLRSMMVGIKNADDLNARGEVWFNELRLAGLDNEGGWAAVAALDANMADFANVSANISTSTSGFGAIDQMPNERAREDAVSYDVVTNVNVGQLFPKKWGLQIPFNYGISESLITPEFDPVYDDLKLDDLIDAAPTAEEADQIETQAEDYTKRTSINFIGVKKNRGEEAEANFYDVENFTLNYSYNKTYHRDFEIANSLDENVNAGVLYNHSFQPLTVEPFAKNDSILKSNYWKWLKEMNFNLLPTTFTAGANIQRQFNQQRFRDVFEDDSESIELPTLQQRNYLFNWQYALNYNISKSLTVNFAGNNNRIVRNYFSDDFDEATQSFRVNPELDIWDGFFEVGEPNRHTQQMQINYDIPLNKIPFLEFATAQYSYTSMFDWQRGGDAIEEALGEQVNTIQNAQTHSLNSTLDMQRLYNFLGLKKRTSQFNNQPERSNSNTGDDGKDKKPKKKTSKGVNTLIDILTMVKRVGINYTENNGKLLPGYNQSVGFIGTTRPTLGFVFGSQENVRFDAARRGYLTRNEAFASNYVESSTSQLNITATAQPTQSLTIDLTANRQRTDNLNENYSPEEWQDNENGLVNNIGNFNISTLMIATAFNKSDEFDSKTFDEFRDNRLTVARRLAARDGITDIDPETGFPVGYGRNSQQVLLPAFFAAYTGQNADKVNLGLFRDVPIPNWNVKYTGLIKNKWFKKKFRRFSIQHGYRSTYSINSYQTNLERSQLINENNALPEDERVAGFNPTNQETGNILPENLVNNVVLSDQFNPLVRVDFEMKNSLSVLAEVRTDRTLSLSLDNSLLTEVNGKEYTLGLGYRLKDVKFVTNLGGERTRLKGDVNFKADVSYRDNITIIRNLDVDTNQITSGQDLWSIKFTADYALSRNLNALFFYDHSFSRFKVSTAFPQTTINAGFTIRYNFGN